MADEETVEATEEVTPEVETPAEESTDVVDGAVAE